MRFAPKAAGHGCIRHETRTYGIDLVGGTSRDRAPAGRHTAWAYCHVPHGSPEDVTPVIEARIERFAPGFRSRILARSSMPATAMERHNANYVGGDINGGVQDLRQLYSRPVLSFFPYRSSRGNVYLCSSSTPPGGGVHGLCGYYAARGL